MVTAGLVAPITNVPYFSRAAVNLLTALVTYIALVPYPVFLPTLSTWNDKVQHMRLLFFF